MTHNTSSTTSPIHSSSAFNTGFAGIPASTTSSSPSSRRSSTLNPLGDKFGRLGVGLPTVEENAAASSSSSSVAAAAANTAPPVAVGSGSPSGSGQGTRRTHTRSKSMKEQLAQFGQDGAKDSTPKTLQSLQDIISSLKNLPPSTSSSASSTGIHSSNSNNNLVNSGSHHGTGTESSNSTSSSNNGHLTTSSSSTGSLSRHEKRLSMSSLPSRSSVISTSASAPSMRESPFPSSTTLHISQPPRGTTIENALQSTVATLRRLSVSDSKRPAIPGRKDDDPSGEPAAAKKNVANRRSVALPHDFSLASSTMDAQDSAASKRASRRSTMNPVPSATAFPTSPAAPTTYQPNRRSVIIKPEEVLALQEGRPYIPTARASYSSDEDGDGVADALSALEGKASISNRSSLSAASPHRRSVSTVDPTSLAEFASRLPSHMQGAGSAAFQNFGQSLINVDDSQDRRRYTTAFHSNRSSVVGPSTITAANRRLSSMAPSKEQDRKDWRMSTPVGSHGHSNRDSVNLKENANGRRPLFMAHLTYSDFHTLLTKQKHKYVQGVLRINKRNRSDAYVTVDSLPEGDVYICGSKDRNRALEGDVVGIELFDFEDMPAQKLEGGKEKKKNKKAEDVEEAGEADVEDIKPKYCGRVVSIVERSLVQMFSGTLTLQRPSGSTKKNERRRQDDDDQKGQPRIVWFKPTDKRVPLIAIPIDQAPADFVENHASYAHKLFVATIKRWPLSSLHPFGHLERELGDIGNIEIETEALLADNNVTTSAFGDKVEKCLPELPWVIPEKELANRRDLRQSCTFTIDPATAKDLDDAVSSRRLEDGNYEIGVHIADVSHFINVGSALDREAKSRATTVYLVQKAIPMLPNILCEDLCSLTANVDRLTFSVFWKMTEDGEVLDTWFAKSVIRSCAQLSYDDAQRVITSGSLDPKVEVFGHPRELVEDNIKIFFKLSQILRQRRFENGALSINSIKLAFETDEINNPLDVSVYELKESNRLIEEFMLLANMSVAKQICDFFPEQALLRRHEEPLEKRMAEFIKHMNKIGIELDASSSGALQASMDAIQDPDVRKVVRLLVIKPMHRAKYICSGMLPPNKYHHYALNAPLYTHFTSPIRRYADIIVHRLLEASLTGDTKFYLNKESCQKSANQCNIKKDAAKLAQEQSSHIYLSMLLKNMTESKGMVIRDAIVVQVLDAAFDVLVPEFGLEKRTLKLYWSSHPFKRQEDEDSAQVQKDDNELPHHDFESKAAGAMDHPDDATNAYDDERGLFDDESDYEDDHGHGNSGHNGAQPQQTDEENDEQATNLTKIKIFGHVQVLITADTTVSPPVIKVVAMNPFATPTATSTA
ncbi:hypothetical protein BGZ94_001686 [Podila epigama]|nr:hypothetical protein BGZ94_001686 [Podila epigama]